MKQKKTKVQQIVAIGSAVIIGTTSTVSAIPTTAFAKDDMEVSTEAYEQLEILDVVDEELKEEKQDTTENENVASENGETVKEKIDIESNTEETPDVEEANDEKTESDEKCENLNDVESKDEKVESSEKEEEIQGKSSVAKAVDVNEVIKLTKNELLSVNYATDSKIADLLAPSWFLSTDILNKRLEIAKRNNVSINSVTEEDAKKELK